MGTKFTWASNSQEKHTKNDKNYSKKNPGEKVGAKDFIFS